VLSHSMTDADAISICHPLTPTVGMWSVTFVTPCRAPGAFRARVRLLMLSRHRFSEDSMEAERRRIELTKEHHHDQVRAASGQEEISAVELNVEQLEERVAPISLTFQSIERTYVPQKPDGSGL
jgi:hypothetical protein